MERLKRFFVFCFVAFLAIIVVTGCNPLMPDKKITLRMDTTIYQNDPVVKPLYSCNTGARLPYNKLMAMNSIPVKISLKKDTIISGNMLPATNGQRKTSDNSGLGWLWPILAGLFGLLMLAALLMLAFWALRRLWEMLFTPKSTGQEGDTANAKTPIVTEPTKKEEVKAPAAEDSARRDEIFNHQLSMAEGLVAKQQIHKINQKTKSNVDGSWESEIEITTKNEKGKGENL